MKKFIFIPLSLIMFLMVSCGPSAQEFNDSMVKEQNAIMIATTSFGNKVQQLTASGSFTGLKSEIDSISAKIDASITNTKALATPSGGEKFRDAAVTYFETIKSAVQVTSKFEALGDKPSVDDVNKVVEEFNTAMEAIQTRENEVVKLQAEFAKEKGLTLLR